MNPDYLPSYGRWGIWNIRVGSDDVEDYDRYIFRKKQEARQRDIAIKRRKAREQRRKMNRHNKRGGK